MVGLVVVGLAVDKKVETTMGLAGLAVEQALRVVRLHQNMRQPIQTQQFKAHPLETVWEGVVLAA